MGFTWAFNPLNAKLNPICHLLALLGAHHILHVSRIRVKVLTKGLDPSLQQVNIYDTTNWYTIGSHDTVTKYSVTFSCS